MAISQIGTASISGLGYGFKNRIINGAMMIDQRNAGASQNITSGSIVYTLDRWLVYTAGSALTSQRVGSVGAYSLQLTGAANNTAIQIMQRIESNNIADLAGQTVTLSFTLSSSTLTTVSFYAQTPTTVDNYSGTNAPVLIGSPTITSTPTRYSFSVTLPANANNGCQIFMQTGPFTSGTITITGVQLEAGTTATPFEFRQYGTELALCQRYYEVAYSDDSTYGIGLSSTYISTANSHIDWRFQTTKRAKATFALGTGATWSTTPTVYPGISGISFVTSTYFYAGQTSGSVVFTASAEL